MISPKRANNKSRKTTKDVIRTVINPVISQLYLTNYRMLRYPRLPHPLFTDTMIAGTVSKLENGNAHVYVTSFGSPHLFPLKLNSDAHEILLLLFNHDGVPPEMIGGRVRTVDALPVREVVGESTVRYHRII